MSVAVAQQTRRKRLKTRRIIGWYVWQTIEGRDHQVSWSKSKMSAVKRSKELPGSWITAEFSR